VPGRDPGRGAPARARTLLPPGQARSPFTNTKIASPSLFLPISLTPRHPAPHPKTHRAPDPLAPPPRGPLRPPPPPRHRHRQLNPRRGTRAESPPFSLLAKPNQSRGAGWGSAETESDDTARSATTHTSGGKRSRERPRQTQTATKSPAALTPPPPRPRGIPTPFR
jgi:hypothetical protein